MWIHELPNASVAILELASEVRRLFPNVSMPADIGTCDLTHLGVYPLVDAEQPAFNPATHTVRHQAPVRDGARYVRGWTVVELSPLQIQANQDALIGTYTSAMDRLFDETAQQKNYDNRVTATLRAGYPGPFQAEGIAFGTWMDTCYAMGYQIMAEVLAGQRPMPTVDEFLALLPTMEWPQ